MEKVSMKREQAIFFEVIQDMALDNGHFEPFFFAYDDFIRGVDFSTLTDLEIHQRAVSCLEKYKDLIDFSCDVDFYDLRWDILEKLDLDDAQWFYLDRKEQH
jgi:hypothetical protein